MSVGYPHTVQVQRPTVTGAEDDWGRDKAGAEDALIELDAWVQAKSAREQDLFAESGAGASTHTIFLYVPDDGSFTLHSNDVIQTHEGGGQPEGARHDIIGIRDPDGTGHHLEVDTLLVERVPA